MWGVPRAGYERHAIPTFRNSHSAEGEKKVYSLEISNASLLPGCHPPVIREETPVKSPRGLCALRDAISREIQISLV